MSITSSILYILNRKVKERAVLKRLKFKTIFLYIHPRFSKTEFFDKLIASDLLML